MSVHLYCPLKSNIKCVCLCYGSASPVKRFESGSTLRICAVQGKIIPQDWLFPQGGNSESQSKNSEWEWHDRSLWSKLEHKERCSLNTGKPTSFIGSVKLADPMTKQGFPGALLRNSREKKQGPQHSTGQYKQRDNDNSWNIYEQSN